MVIKDIGSNYWSLMGFTIKLNTSFDILNCPYQSFPLEGGHCHVIMVQISLKKELVLIEFTFNNKDYNKRFSKRHRIIWQTITFFH